MLVVMVLGDSAILRCDREVAWKAQQKVLHTAALSVAEVAKKHQLVLIHAGGPQVGLLSLMGGRDEQIDGYPLDVLGAQTPGVAGFAFEQELRNAMPGQKVLSVTIQTVVNTSDPAFSDPGYAIGSPLTYDQAQIVQSANPDWTLTVAGNYFRRVVPSPTPQDIIELACLRHIVSSGDITVVCGGGGGIPVCRDAEGELHGIEAVIDKDRTSPLLAEGLEADGLVILTDIEALETDFKKQGSRKIKHTTPEALDQLAFEVDSMGPKVESVCQFISSGGKFAAIGILDQAAEIVAGRSGTQIRANVPNGIVYYE